ncbi:hypothetical protein GDO81_006163 [Engystomops pustulosus]|uniref:Uncharacterized protein n=1 Tax=Engystomops pustulosus TaxID=76066 RepID=A0AAV7CUY9_ENGPU|nr:hypothetical protein GDO81_006163 [Engystomops pustulosus]
MRYNLKYISEWERLSKSQNPPFSLDIHCFTTEVKEETVDGQPYFEDLRIPSTEQILKLAPRLRPIRTTKIRNCHKFVKQLVDYLN